MLAGVAGIAGFSSAAAGAGATPYAFIAAGALANDTAGGAISPAYPAGFVAGDTLICVLIGSLASGTETATTPTGWSLVGTIVGAGGAIFVYGRTADGSETGSLAITHAGATSNDHWSAMIFAYGGCAATGQFVDVQTNSGSGTSVVYPSVTLSVANQIKFEVGASVSGSGTSITFSTPTGFNARGALNGAFRSNAGVFDKQFVSSGATGTESANHSTSGAWAAVAFGLLAV